MPWSPALRAGLHIHRDSLQHKLHGVIFVRHSRVLDRERPTPKQAAIIMSMRLLGGVGHFLLIRAFRVTMASTLSPLLYAQLVWAPVLGWLVFGQLADPLTAIGLLVIGGSSLSLALRRPVRKEPGERPVRIQDEPFSASFLKRLSPRPVLIRQSL
ncbi:MAG: DMT family transporter [Deltaproteobacteria bacterium]|nr:DMT family transporter [Deltaproteobacteria bacterium]